MSTFTFAAKRISRVLNPFSLSVVALLLVTYSGTGNLKELGTWALILLFFLVILPLAYVYVRTSARGESDRRMPELLRFFRERRKEIWVMGIIAGVPCLILLIILGAPAILIAILVALLGSSLAIALINRLFRASYHLSTVTILAITGVSVWGHLALPALVIIPLVGWARFATGEHSPAQLAAGFGIAVIISGASLYGFGALV